MLAMDYISQYLYRDSQPTFSSVELVWGWYELIPIQLPRSSLLGCDTSTYLPTGELDDNGSPKFNCPQITTSTEATTMVNQNHFRAAMEN